ncbi:MAG: RDD family protein [Verrucomicrobiota bacterium]
MQIWLIQHGKKTGPFQDYEIRNRITDGQIEPDQFAWHEGLPGWVKLREIELFREDLERTENESVTGAEIVSPPNKVEPPVVVSFSGKRYLGRRFWARWLDLVVYSAVWWLLMYVAGRNIGLMIENEWLMISMLIPWFALESWLLHRFGTTPGKWLLGIRVVNDDDTPLTFKSSIWRSIRVMIAGVGFGWGLLSLLCQAMSWFTTRKIGKPVWDYMGKHKITVAPLKAFKIIALILLFFTAIQLQSAVRGPYDQEKFLKEFPQWKEFFDKGKPYYFPMKH